VIENNQYTFPADSTVFSENFKVTAAPIAEGVHAFVIDHALADPDALVQFATKTKAAFRDAPPAMFPGIELRMTDAFSAKFDDFFRLHLRKYFDARRTQSYSTRLSMVTQKPQSLHAAQWLPQADLQYLTDTQATICFDLNLYRDESLGGIGFYMPRKQARDIITLIHESQTLSSEAFATKNDLRAGYCVEANPYFQLTQVIPARYNRLVVYDGAMFRAPHITSAEKLTSDAGSGRLMLQGHLLCKRHADGRANRRRS
jgi:Family of unknown function (DUF6445)